jgi:superfamily II DNA helicase RecQ
VCGEWEADADAKLAALVDLLNVRHPKEKVLIFTQFADTARYIKEHLTKRGVKRVEAVTGQSPDPALLAWRFSPLSNEKRSEIRESEELNAIVATDVLSEGQNLQDAHIIVNYDIPWAIIRLIQRAGRVDRIGQKSDSILCYSFIPADGVERIIRLRDRIRRRLSENAEVVGSDESFFDDETGDKVIHDLYTEKEGILDDDGDSEVDLASFAYQIWKNATDADPSLIKRIETMPNMVYATKKHDSTPASPCGALVYMRTAQDNDALTWVDEAGNHVTQSQFSILKAAACSSVELAQPRQERHHELTQQGVSLILNEEKSSGGALGRPSGARFKVYERLKRLRERIGNRRNLFITDESVRILEKIIEEVYRYPLYQSATDRINRQIKTGIDDERLYELVLSLHEDDRFCIVDEQEVEREPKLICSIGLAPNTTPAVS